MDLRTMQSELFKAIAHPERIKILEELIKGKCCVNEMVNKIKNSQPQVSRHLTAMKKSGLLECEKNGTRICYRIKSQEVAKILALSKEIIIKNTKEITGLPGEDN